MIIKAFRAPTVQEALAKVKATYGPSALIIETNKVKPPGLLGFLRTPLVEVVVGIEEAPLHAPAAPFGPAPVPQGPTPTGWAAEVASLRGLESDIAEMKDALRLLTGAAAEAEAPAEELVLDLVERGFDRPTATEMAEEAQEAQARAGRGELAEHLQAVLARRFATAADEARPAEATPRVLAFIGPTGAGKTTLLAKLAGRFALQRGEAVALASVDGVRVGAVEQVKSYAEILGLPFHVVPSPDAVPRLVEAASGAAWLLVDTPGLPFHDTARLGQLAAWLGAFPRVERHLVLSAASETRATLAAVAAFGLVGFERLAFTKLDEARQGALLAAAADVAGVPISYLGVGQDVAQDLELARPDRLAQLVLEPQVRSASAE